jgi:hypothetical protein
MLMEPIPYRMRYVRLLLKRRPEAEIMGRDEDDALSSEAHALWHIKSRKYNLV